MHVSIGNAITATAHHDYANTIAAITMHADDLVTAKGDVNVVEVASVGENRSRVALTFTNDEHTARVLREVLEAMGDPVPSFPPKEAPAGPVCDHCGTPVEARVAFNRPDDTPVCYWTHMGRSSGMYCFGSGGAMAAVGGSWRASATALARPAT